LDLRVGRRQEFICALSNVNISGACPVRDGGTYDPIRDGLKNQIFVSGKVLETARYLLVRVDEQEIAWKNSGDSKQNHAGSCLLEEFSPRWRGLLHHHN
jgi:hypothetical protein